MRENAYSDLYKACMRAILQTLKSTSQEISVKLKTPNSVKLGAPWKEETEEMLLFQR